VPIAPSTEACPESVGDDGQAQAEANEPQRCVPSALQQQHCCLQPHTASDTDPTGCITCKNKHLKCDETKPTCTQCGKRSVTCGGYKKEFRWQAFEEPSVPGKQATTPLVLKNIDRTYSMPQDYTDSTTQLELDDSQIHPDWTTPVDLNGSQIQLLGNIDPTYCMPLEYTNLTTPLALEVDNPQIQALGNIDPTHRMPVDYTSCTIPPAPEFSDPQMQVRENIDPTHRMPADYTSWTIPPALEFNDPTYRMPVDYTSCTIPPAPEFSDPQMQVRENIDPTHRMPADYTSWTIPPALEFNDPTYRMPVDYTNWTTPLALEVDNPQIQALGNIDPTHRMPVDYTSWTSPLALGFDAPQPQLPKNIDSTHDMGHKRWTPIPGTTEHRKGTRVTLTFSDISAVSSPPQTGKLLHAFMHGHQDIKTLSQEEFNFSITNAVASGKADLVLKPLATPSTDEKTKRPHESPLSLEDNGGDDQRLGRKEYRTDNESRLSTSCYKAADGSIMWGDQAQRALPKGSDDGVKSCVESPKRSIDKLYPDYRIEDDKEDSDSRPFKRCKS
jgi:hypothetical protein